MKVLVFAHTPPPHHGQSYMVRLMLDHAATADGPDGGLIFHHVNARLSDDMEDIGSWRAGKLFRLLGYIVQAWLVRIRFAPEAFYYVPAPAKRSALYRDWLVFLLVAPLFRFRVLHWHATGLGAWVQEGARLGVRRRFEAWLTRQLLGGKELSLILSEEGRGDVEIFAPGRIAVVPNGIPDPCPDFASTLLPRRQERARARQAGNGFVFELLHLAHATRTKGLFDAVEAVARANARLASKNGAARFRLTVAGAFVDREEEALFRQRIGQDDLLLAPAEGNARAVVHAGYVQAAEKEALLRHSDALCFASYFPNEAQPVAVIEALAYGLPVLLSRWRGLPGMVPEPLRHLAEPRDPDSIAEALTSLLHEDRFEACRSCYLERYSLATHCSRLREAFFSLET